MIVVSSYRDLADTLRAERIRQGMSCEELDYRAGLTDRYVQKLERWQKGYGRMYGDMSLHCILTALGLRLCIVRATESAETASDRSDSTQTRRRVGA